jgi:hypothetical protein
MKEMPTGSEYGAKRATVCQSFFAVQTFEALADALRSSPSDNGGDELHVRRERTRLLAAFDASLVPAVRASRAGRWLIALASVAAVCGLAIVFSRSRPTAAIPSSAFTESIAVRAEPSAQWSRRTEDQRETITLQSGALSVHIDHALSPRRLIVILPDGELEDIGTTFAVSADAGHTTRVAVEDGSVVLRLHGAAPLALGAGDSWPPASVHSDAPVPVAPSVTTARSSKPLALTVPRVATPHIAASPSPTQAPSAAGPDRDPSVEFRAALSALNDGNNVRAASLFAAFLAEHPRDPRIEDAAYLRVLALQRSGDTSAMKQAAAEYLARYPRGFRRADVEGLR